MPVGIRLDRADLAGAGMRGGCNTPSVGTQRKRQDSEAVRTAKLPTSAKPLVRYERPLLRGFETAASGKNCSGNEYHGSTELKSNSSEA